MSKEKQQTQVNNSPNKELTKKTGQRLADLREKERLSVRELVAQLSSERRNGAYIKISESQYKRIEQGYCFMNYGFLVAICKFYNVTANYIVFGNNDSELAILSFVVKEEALKLCQQLKQLLEK